MSDKLNFSLPKQKIKQPLILIIMLVLLAVSTAINVFMVISAFVLPGGPRPANAAILPVSKQKELALKLQKESLYEAAVQAWKDYLAVANPGTRERAAVWYTIGKIYQEAALYEQALDSYYKSEAIHKQDDIKDELARRVQESLEMMGKFAALRYELADRVGIAKQQAGDEVLAEIGTEKITKADLDRKIEEYIDFQVSQYAAFMDPGQLKQQREELFKQFSGADGQAQMLNQYIVEELLYRKAREDRLGEDSLTRALLKETERKVLAQQLVTKKKGSLINITEADLKAYYEAQKADYIKDGKLRSFDEVKNELYTKLIDEKGQQVEQQLIDELRKQYNVVLHPPKAASTAKDAPGQK